MEELLERLLEECRPYTAQGKLADYIPELAKGDISDLGIYVVRSDGKHYHAGSYKKNFTIQSVVKPILLLLTLMDNGVDYVRSKSPLTPSMSQTSACSATTSIPWSTWAPSPCVPW